MKKPTPTTTMNMSMTQDDMNQFIQQKAAQAKADFEKVNKSLKKPIKRSQS